MQLHNAASGMSLSADGKYLFCTTAGENDCDYVCSRPGNRHSDKKFTLPDQW